MERSIAQRRICGIWISPASEAHLSVAVERGGREAVREPFHPFCWLAEGADVSIPDGASVRQLAGRGRFSRLVVFPNIPSWRAFLSENHDAESLDYLRSIEGQHLMARNERLFDGMLFSELRRCQIDIETACSKPQGFSDAGRAEDRVLAIGLRFGDRQEILVIEEPSDKGERRLLERFNEALQREDPDTVEGHNIFRFDLDFLRRRAQRLKTPCVWGRFGQTAWFRNSRLRVAERWLDFPRCDMPGRAVIDTYLLVQLYDLAEREMSSYGLKEVALHLGITDERLEKERTYLGGNEIEKAFYNDRDRFLRYLADDLRETQGLADLLLPTYFAQASGFPMTLQDATLRGAGAKVDILMVQEYYNAGQALPSGEFVEAFEGAFAHSFETGVFRRVLHFDVASLYPSILLSLNRNPRQDSLGVFIPLLRKLREYRLRYKAMARQAEDQALRTEYQARQTSFKILINSFYGYLGFAGAHFCDGELAARVTEKGRFLLQRLIEEFKALGCRILEADTDGIYLTCDEEAYRAPEKLLKPAAKSMPAGIDIEFDGCYEAMFCYKAKNYALWDGEKIVLRGSALRSRGTEPFLQKLTRLLIRWLLGIEKESPLAAVEACRRRIMLREMPVEELARAESLSQNPEAYRKNVNTDAGRPRRSSLEAALRMDPPPRMGDRVRYFIAHSKAGRSSPEWQRARPIAEYDSKQMPYDADYYSRKLDEWIRRYESFIKPQPKLEQGELF